MAWPNRPHPPSQFSICVKIHLSSTFSLESDPLPKCYHFRKIVNSAPIYFSASWLCFPHYIGCLTRRQKQIIDNISCVAGVTWVNRITENHHWLVIIVSQQPTPLIVILSYTATLGGLQTLSFINFIPKVPSLWGRLSWSLMTKVSPMILQSGVPAQFIICSRNHQVNSYKLPTNITVLKINPCNAWVDLSKTRQSL